MITFISPGEGLRVHESPVMVTAEERPWQLPVLAAGAAATAVRAEV